LGFVLLIIATAVGFGQFGLDGSRIFFISQNKLSINTGIHRAVVHTLFAGIMVFTCLSLLTTSNLFPEYNNLMSSIKTLMTILITLQILRNQIFSMCLAMQKYITVNKITIFQTAVVILLLITFWLLDIISVRRILHIHLVGTIVGLIMIFKVILREKNNYPASEDISWKEEFKFGFAKFLSFSIMFLNLRMHQYFLSWFGTPTQLGLYTVAMFLAEKIWLLPNTMAHVIFPMASKEKGLKKEDLSELCRLSFHFVFLISIIMAIASPFLIPLLYSKDFSGAIIPLWIILPGIIALSIGKILNGDLQGRGKPYITAFIAFLGLIFQGIAGYIFIPENPMNGSALVASMTYIFITLIYIIYYTRKKQLNISSLFHISIFKDTKKMLNAIRSGE